MSLLLFVQCAFGTGQNGYWGYFNGNAGPGTNTGQSGLTNLQGSNIVGSIPLVALPGSSPTNPWSGTFTALSLASSNILIGGTTTNLDADEFVPVGGANISLHPVPEMYFLQGGNTTTETNVCGWADQLVSNGWVNYGFRWVQLDAGMVQRNTTNNQLQFNPTNFQDSGAFVSQYFHNRGLLIGGYATLAGGPQFGNATSLGYEVQDAWTMATNFNWDEVKTDLGSEIAEKKYWLSALFSTGHPFYLQTSDTGEPYPGATWNASRYNYLVENTVYGTPGADPTSPYVWTNVIAHFHGDYLAAQFFTGPGKFVEGVGWAYVDGTTFSTNSLELGLLLAENLNLNPIGAPNTASLMTNNPLPLKILRDKLVSPGRLSSYVVNGNGTTNGVYVRSLGDLYGDNKYVVLVNEDATSDSFTLSATNMNWPSGTAFTLTSPWAGPSTNNPGGVITAWATNTFTTNVPTLNTMSFYVQRGIVAPAFNAGTSNYLSVWPWKINAINPVAPNIRWGTALPLTVNSVNYPYGFSTMTFESSGPTVTNTYYEFPIPPGATSFSAVFGIQDAWNPSSGFGGRLTVYTNGSIAFQTAFVTNNSPQATNITVNLTNCNFLGLYVDQSVTGNAQYVIGNATVTMPGPALSNGNFTGSFAGTVTGTANPGKTNDMMQSFSNAFFIGTNAGVAGGLGPIYLGATGNGNNPEYYGLILGPNADTRAVRLPVIYGDGSNTYVNIPSGGGHIYFGDLNLGLGGANMDTSGNWNFTGGGTFGAGVTLTTGGLTLTSGSFNSSGSISTSAGQFNGNGAGITGTLSNLKFAGTSTNTALPPLVTSNQFYTTVSVGWTNNANRAMFHIPFSYSTTAGSGWGANCYVTNYSGPVGALSTVTNIVCMTMGSAGLTGLSQAGSNTFVGWVNSNSMINIIATAGTITALNTTNGYSYLDPQ